MTASMIELRASNFKTLAFVYIWNWHERLALQSVAVRQSISNDVNGLLFLQFFLFLAQGVGVANGLR